MKTQIRIISNLRLCKKYIITRFISSLGILLMIKDLFLLLDKFNNYGNCMFIIILFVSAIYSLSFAFIRKDSVTLVINKRTKLTIGFGDLFDSKGMIVIPVNEYFDTHLGNGIIAPGTIHGQFLRLFEGRICQLRDQIDNQLRNIQPLKNVRDRDMVKGLPNKRYPLGTSIRIEDKEMTYLLIAVARFNKYEHTDVKTSDYPLVIQKLFYYIEQLSNNNPVYVPLIGSGQAGYQLSNMQMIRTIIRSAQNADSMSVVKGINLVLHESCKDVVNLNYVEQQFSNWDIM